MLIDVGNHLSIKKYFINYLHSNLQEIWQLGRLEELKDMKCQFNEPNSYFQNLPFPSLVSEAISSSCGSATQNDAKMASDTPMR